MAAPPRRSPASGCTVLPRNGWARAPPSSHHPGETGLTGCTGPPGGATTSTGPPSPSTLECPRRASGGSCSGSTCPGSQPPSATSGTTASGNAARSPARACGPGRRQVHRPLPDQSRKKYYQFTAIDDRTWIRVLRIYDQLNPKTAIQPTTCWTSCRSGSTRSRQTFNGSEFQSAFHCHPMDRGIRHIYVKPATPRLNGSLGGQRPYERLLQRRPEPQA
jgi:hypothetical protein